MTIRELIDAGWFSLVNEGRVTSRKIEDVFCCDLLSIAMARGVENAAWVTVMGNMNTIAVLSLTDMALIVLAEGARMDETGLAKARQEGVTILSSDLPVFHTARKIYEAL